MALGDIGTYEGYVYSVALASGVMAAGLAAGSPIYSFRNASAKPIRLLTVEFNAAVGATGFTANTALFELVRATAWTIADSGGAAATLTGNAGSHRSSQGKSVIAGSDVRIATTATLTAGTRVLDSVAHRNIVGAAGSAGTPIIQDVPLYIDWASYGIPLVLGVNEGFIIRASVPVTGTWGFGVNAVWGEVSS